jgi:FAD/FMN-containing dehydrogenase
MNGSSRGWAGRGSGSCRGQALAQALSRRMKGGVAADPFTRGRYATDASIYQIMPLAVAFPRDADDVAAALEVARAHGAP